MRRYFFAGLLVWLPIIITLYVIGFLVGLLDRSVNILPMAYHPDALLGVHIPGFGVVLSFMVLFVTGMLVTNFLGRKLVAFWEKILARIPLVRSIYSSSKQVIETLFSSNGQAFRKVLLVEYPRKGCWSIAFQTGAGTTELRDHLGEELVTLFVPTTPNPTSGFLIIVPKKDITELSMSVDDALKMVISLGVIQPTSAVINIQQASKNL
ncbi:MAG: hypothetical protein K0S11_717 [Gammaproteobacteria bacterium]|jgi:uncharacterized membrane protein|nr:hypothetical protein [Gammaproteobacteria bacterium]